MTCAEDSHLIGKASLFGVILGRLPTSAQKSEMRANSGGLLLAQPRAGVPICFGQTEEHSRKTADGSSVVTYVVTGGTRRDSKGGLRRESITRDLSRKIISSSISISDLSQRFKAILLSSDKIAYRMPLPTGKSVGFSFADAADGQEFSHQWKVTKRDLGKRIIEGVEFEGARIVTIAEDDPALTTTINQWYSVKLGLIGAIERSGPYSAYTVKIEHLHFGEPDPSLFQIPSDYKIIDVASP